MSHSLKATREYRSGKNLTRSGLRAVFFAGILFPLVNFATDARASFSQSTLSMAGESISGGFSAKADDPSAIFLNPAGLSQISRAEVSLSYSKPFAGLAGVSFQQGYAALALPVNQKWTLALAGNSFDANGLLTEQEGAMGVIVQVSNRLAVGTNVTYMRHSYNVTGETAQDPFFSQGHSKGAMGIDAGALLKASRFVTLGLSGRHLNRPDVGLVSKDLVPMELLGGARLHFGQLSLLADVMLRDAGQNISNRRETTWALGTEWSIMSRLALRAGMNRGSLATGIGFSVGDFRLDYSFSLSNFLEQDNASGHHAVLSYRFGRDRAEKNNKKVETFTQPKHSKPSIPVKKQSVMTTSNGLAVVAPVKPASKQSDSTALPTAEKQNDKNAPYNFLKKGF